MSECWAGRRVLVTGATAFTGSFLVEQLLKAGAEVRVPFRITLGAIGHLRNQLECVQGDLSDSAFCAQVLDNIDALFHLASTRFNVAYHREHRDEVIAGNEIMTKTLIGALKQQKAIPVTYFSTAMAGSLELQGTSLADMPDGYIAGKILCEQHWHQAAQEQGFPLLVVRSVNIYGPRDTFSQKSNVIPSLIMKAEKSTGHLTVWGSGAQERSFLYVEDVTEALLTLIEAGAHGVQYLCPPESVTIRALAEQIRDLVHPELPIAFDTSKPEGVSSVARFPMHECLQDFSWTPLKEGLRRTVEWYKSEV